MVTIRINFKERSKMKTLLKITGGLSIAALAVVIQPLSQAQMFPKAPSGCVYLREVITGRTEIRKVVAANNSNANTDFAVPTGTRFTNYNAKFIPENNTRFNVEVNLRNSDNSTSRVVSRGIDARRFYLYNQPFRTPTDKQPFQINTRVTAGRNNAYRIAVLACQ
jgi:hypothetical protein